MPLESAVYLDDLVVTNPSATDGASAGDDHIRLIKSVLKNTWPNVNDEVTLSAADMNLLDTNLTALIGLVTNPIPAGCILAWYSTSGSVPAGWGVCDGSVYAKSDGSGNITSPDLRNRFIVCTGTTYAQGTSGGTVTSSSDGAHTHSTDSQGAHTHSVSSSGAHTHTTDAGGDHNHTGATGSTAITEANLPAHQHFVAFGNLVGSPATLGSLSSTNYLYRKGGAGTDDAYQLGGDTSVADVGLSSSVGSGTGHTHTISASGTHTHTIASGGAHTHTTGSDGAHTHTAASNGAHTHTTTPPYYSLIYIIKK